MNSCNRLPYVIMLFLLFFCFVVGVYSRENCSSDWTYIYYCDDGWYCCHLNRLCCKSKHYSPSSTSSGLSGGAIAGIVIGCLAGAGCFLCSFFSSVCKSCNKDKQRVRQVTYPRTTAPNTGVQFISSGQEMTPQTSYGQPFPGQPSPAQPPLYETYTRK